MTPEHQSRFATAPPRLANYDIGAELGRGAMSVVYRAQRGEHAYAVKFMSPGEGPLAGDQRLALRREAAAIARLHHPSLVEVIEVGESDGLPYLVMDLAHGENLELRLGRAPMTCEEVVSVGRSVASALEEVHRFGLLHRDIKPANLVIDAGGAVKLIDFGLVTTSADPHAIVGTLHYAAPEQLGVLKRPVTAASDLYALGATLFECLTGRPPIDGSTDGDFFHRLATSPAPDVRSVRADVRPALACIIAKLLAKDPDDRYQRAHGLFTDLGRLSEIDDALAEGRDPGLGVDDGPLGLDQSLPLIGRREELARLQRAWAQARRGETVFIQIEGEGGSGKTRLAREFAANASAQGARVLSGKCQEHETVPFGPLREAAEQFVTSMATLPPAERAAAETLARTAAGDHAPLVRRLCAGLERLLDGTPDLRALDPDAEQQRYYEALARFFRRLATPQSPLVLLLDDIHWLDEGSLRVLERLAAGASHAPILVLSTSRDNAGAQEGLGRYVEMAGEKLAVRVDLRPLRLKAVNELITARLGGKPLDPPAVEKLAALTHGNPFAVGEYLRSLIESGVVRPSANRWTADPAAIDAVKLPKDVVELVVSRLFSLGAENSRLTSIAGIIGVRFSLGLLGRVAGVERAALGRQVNELVRAGLLERCDGDTYSFIHDRVREAAVERLSEQHRRDHHQAIAEALDEQSDGSVERLYALARHYAGGHVSRNPRRVAETSLDAGLRALDDHANEDSFHLLDRAYEIAREAAPGAPHSTKLLEGLGRACALTGRLERAFLHLEDALRQARGEQDRFRLQYLLTLTYASQGRNDEALAALYETFATIRRPFPRLLVLQVLTLCVAWLSALFLRATGLRYGSARGVERERRQVLSQLHYAGSMIALFQGRPVLMVQFIVRDLLNVHFLGASAETAIAYSVYGAVLGTFQLRSVMERYVRAGVEMAERLGDRAALAICKAYEAVGAKWAGDLVRGNKLLVEALPELHRHVPGSWYAAMMICEQAYSYLHAGRSTQAIEHVRASASQLERTNNLMFRYNTRSVLYAQLMVCGQVSEAAALWSTLEREYRPLSKTIYVGLARCIAELETLIDQDNTGPEMDESIAAFQGLLSEDYYSNAARVLTGYARLAQLAQATPATRKAARRRLEQAILALQLRAMVPVFRCHVFILKAVLARVDGKFERAARLLATGDRLAAVAGSRRGGYYAALERARLARATGDPAATYFANVALTISRAEGWRNNALKVRAEFGLREDHARSSAHSTIAAGTQARSVDQLRRYGDALLQVSLASASTLDPHLQAQNALAEVASVLGAERALFFLMDPTTGELELSASSGAGSDAERISQTVVRRVVESRAPVVLSGTDDGEALGSQSIMAYGLRSIIAAPLMVRDQMLGVVYLDNRLAKGVFTDDDVRLLLGVSNHIAIAIVTGRSARIEAERAALMRDLELLGAVQTLLLPKSGEFAGVGLRGAGVYRPAAQCGGDWWWHEVAPDGSALLVLGDVSGHGAPSAMITSAVAGAFHTIRNVRPEASPGEILRELDRRIVSFGGGFHMTMCVVRLDAARRELTCWSAAAPPIFVQRRGGDCETVAPRGNVLGDTSNFRVGEATVPFGPGDRLLMCTDGVLELRGAAGRELGVRGVSKLFTRLAQTPVDGLASGLAAELDLIADGRRPDDDVTFIFAEASHPNPTSEETR